MKCLAFGVSLLVLTQACASTSYVPQNRRFVTTRASVMSLELSRCEQRAQVDPFFSGVDEIFPADSRSRALAKSARKRQTTSAVVVIAGSVLAMTGTVMYIVDQTNNGSNGIGTAGSVGIGLFGGGLAVSLAGAPLQLKARAELLDAVNVYNDEVANLSDAEVCN
ncbi:MAG: hypothetical protein AAGD10_07910 [Myxococcota bacterium]